MYNEGDRICVRDPSDEFYVIGEVVKVVEYPPVVAGMPPVRMYYVASYQEHQNVNSDELVESFYDCVMDGDENIITDENLMLRLFKEQGYDV